MLAERDGQTEAIRSLTLERPAVAASVGEIRRALTWFARECGASGAVSDAVALAVSEATTNVVQHAYRAEPGPLTVLARATQEEMTVTVSDRGIGLRAGCRSPGLGIGLALIARSADRIDLDTRRGGGLAIHMTFTLS